MVKYLPIAGSLLIHLAIIIVFLFLPTTQNKISPVKIDVLDISENRIIITKKNQFVSNRGGTAIESFSKGENIVSRQEKSNEQIDPTDTFAHDNTEPTQTFQKSLESDPLFAEIFRKINTQFEYPIELERENIEGIVGINLNISLDGKIKSLKVLNSSNQKITGYALMVIKKAFEKPLEKKHIKKDFQVSITFELGIYFSRGTLPVVKEAQVGNSIHLSRYLVRPNKLVKLSNNADFGSQEDKAILFDLVQIWKVIFGNKKTSNRMAWDLEFKKNEFIWACENQNAEGGCYNAGLIEEAFGNHKKAVYLFEKACTLELKIACDKLVNDSKYK
jgi:TonB family protein